MPASSPTAQPSEGGAKLSQLLALARPEAPALALGLVFLFLSSGTSLAFPQAVRVVVDGATGVAEVGRIDRAALAMIGIVAVQGVAIALRYVIFAAAGERIVTRLREQLYRGIITQEVGFFDGRRTGELVSRLSGDTAVIQSAVSLNVSMALRNIVLALGGVALLFVTSTRLALVMLSVVPAVALAANAFGRRVRRLARDTQDALADSGHVAEETLGAIRTVRAFTQEEAEARRYGVAVERAFQVARRRIGLVGAFIGVGSFAGYGAAAVVLWYGGRLVAQGELTPGQLTSFMLYTLTAAFSIGALGDLWGDFMRAAGAADRVFELLHREPLVPLHGGATPAEVKGHVSLREVRFAYPSRPEALVLDDVSLSIAPGEVVALVGPSGSGKSTIAALLMRFYDPQGGHVLFDDHDVRELDPLWLRRQIGVVAQEPVLLSMSIAANIRYGRDDASDAAVEEAARAANAHGFITSFPRGFDTLVGERGVQLSGGQKQRVAIARALIKDPRVLILDEATSALDAQSEHAVKEALERLQRGRTTLVIAHRLSTVRSASRIVVLERGRVAQIGTHEELMARDDGVYRRLIERQVLAR